MIELKDLIAELEGKWAKEDAQPKWRRSLREFRRKMYWSNLKYSIRKHTKEKWQRAHRGYSTQDTWNFDIYISGLLAAGITELRNRDIGYPVIDPTLADAESRKFWHDIQTEMIEGFTLHTQDPTSKKEKDKVDRAFQLLAKYYIHLWD